MITALANTPDGKRVIVLGVSRGNIDRLLAGQPIDITAESHPGFPPDLNIAIFFGETERDLTQSLQELITEETKVTVVPREKPPVQ